jgi:hypothetical protein
MMWARSPNHRPDKEVCVKKRGVFLAAFAVLLLIAVSPLLADSVIHRGVDTFTTIADGKTFYDFAQNPIPAGFFCRSSAAFTGKMTFKGLPLETGAPGQLHGADTVIERLDDAAFDNNNTAVTRIQFRALSLVSIAPLKTACGSYHVYVTLAGKQRETTMRIYRTSEGGGKFVAPLAVDARLSFIPVKPERNKKAGKLELVGNFTFPAAPMPWSTTGRADAKRIGAVLVDTNGDLIPDTLVFGSTNFAPGWDPKAPRKIVQTGGSCTICEPASCHTDPATGKQHCTGPVQACGNTECP